MTTETKGRHTAGPWTMERVESDGALVYARIGPAGKGSIAYSGVYGPRKHNARLTEEEAEANARLIAAAPEMVELLRRMVNGEYYEEDYQSAQEEASALLARIGGE